MAAAKTAEPIKKDKTYKLRSQNKFLFIASNYGKAQFINGEFETANKDLYYDLLRYNDVVAV